MRPKHVSKKDSRPLGVFVTQVEAPDNPDLVTAMKTNCHGKISHGF